MVLTDNVAYSTDVRQNISFRNQQLQQTLFDELNGREQEEFMVRLRNDTLLPTTTISSENQINPVVGFLPSREGTARENVSDLTSPLPLNTALYEFGSKPSQLRALGEVQANLVERISIARQYNRGEITLERMKEFASKMKIILLHGGPGNGKSFTIKNIIQIAESFGLNSIIMAFSGTAASQFKNGKTIHSSCGWNIRKNISSFSTINKNTMPSKVAMMGPQPCMIVIDECSMIGPKWVANISHPIKQIVRSKINDLNHTECADTFLSNTTLNFVEHAPLQSYTAYCTFPYCTFLYSTPCNTSHHPVHCICMRSNRIHGSHHSMLSHLISVEV